MPPEETTLPSQRSDAPPERTAVQTLTDERDRVENIFTALDKAIKGLRLYQGGGPLVERLLDDLDNRLRNALSHGAITVRVASFGLVYKGWPITIDDKRVPYLFQLFCDGVRELTFLEGVTRDEIKAFVEILGGETRGDEDMVTTLWQRNLPHLRYYAADTFTAGVEVGEDGEMMLAGARAAGRFDQGDGSQEIALSASDIRLLTGEGHLEWVKDAAAQVHATGRAAELAARIRSSFQTPTDIRRFVALGIRMAATEGQGFAPMASPLVVDVYDALLSSGQSTGVAELLSAVLDIPERAQADPTSPVIRAVESLFQTLTVGERMQRMAPLVDREPDRFLPALERVVARAKDGMVTLLLAMPPTPAQSKVHALLTQAGVDLTDYYNSQLASEKDEVVIHAIRSLGELGTPMAVKALSSALSRNSTAIRKAALEAMIGKYHPEARIGLARALRDPSPECRQLALRVLATSNDNRVAWGLLTAVQDPAFAQKEPEEQVHFYRALAAFGDPRVQGHFKEILSRRNVMRSRAITTTQILAARALGEAGTPEARATLEEFRDYKSHPREVHQAVEEALSSRRKP